MSEREMDTGAISTPGIFRTRGAMASLILIANTFIWYLYAFNVLPELVRGAHLTSAETSIVWTANFAGAVAFALVGATLTARIGKRTRFLAIWIATGVVASLMPAVLDVSTGTNLGIFAFLFGASFGIGMPVSMAYFCDSTVVENRARTGGIIFFTIGLGAFLLGVMDVGELTSRIAVLAAWRGLGLVLFLLARPSKEVDRGRSLSYKAILGQRSFLLYLAPWAMFCLVNQTSAPVLTDFFGKEFMVIQMALEATLAGLFAIVSGLLCDKIGRKRIAVSGFAMLGVGYAALGVFPQSLLSWYLYTLADGIAWGIFYTVFFTTVWGDLAYGAPSEKYYAIGGLPYLLSNLLRFTVGSYITETVSMYTIFSLASFFLFLAVLPLMYAPETLTEKTIQETQLKDYVKRAKKIRNKYL